MKFSEQVIANLLLWIDANLELPLRLDEIAQFSGYSKWHLQRLFTEYTGETLGRYIRNKKLQKAAEDLCTSSDKIYDISLRYGYETQQSFTRIFTVTFHQTPGFYRKSRRNQKKISIRTDYR